MANVYPLDIQQNYRTPAPEPLSGGDITVTTDDQDQPAFDPVTGTVQIDLPDGEVVISFGEPQKPKKSSDFDDNLADQLSDAELAAIAEKLLTGIEQDTQSRSAWLENMSSGISLLGLGVQRLPGQRPQKVPAPLITHDYWTLCYGSRPMPGVSYYRQTAQSRYAMTAKVAYWLTYWPRL